MRMRSVYLWSARVKDAVIMRVSSYALPRRATHFSDCTALVCRSWPTPWPRCAAAGLLKTRNQFVPKTCNQLYDIAPRKPGTVVAPARAG